MSQIKSHKELKSSLSMPLGTGKRTLLLQTHNEKQRVIPQKVLCWGPKNSLKEEEARKGTYLDTLADDLLINGAKPKGLVMHRDVLKVQMAGAVSCQTKKK